MKDLTKILAIITVMLSVGACTMLFGPSDDDGDSSGEQTTEDNTSDSEDNISSGAKAPQAFWGSWIRMDTGAEYFFTASELKDNGSISSAAAESVTVGGTTYTLESDNVIRSSSNFLLFRAGGANRSFSVQVAGFQDTLSASGFVTASSSETIPQEDHPLRRRSPTIPEDEEETTTDESGTAQFTNSVADTEQVIETEYQPPVDETAPDEEPQTNTITTEVTPQYDGEFVGTIPLVEKGHNFKVTYSVGEPDSVPIESTGSNYMYGNGYAAYPVTININNIGDADAETSVLQLDAPPGLRITGDTYKNLRTIEPGDSETIAITAEAGSITGDYQDFRITVTIEDTGVGRVWEDYVVLRFYRLPVTFRTAALNIDENTSAKLKSFLITPDNRSIFFETAHSRRSDLTVPYRSEPYTLVLSGATAETEMKYSFAVQRLPTPTNGLEGTWTAAQITEFSANSAEPDAYQVTSLAEPVDGYLKKDQVTFFDVELSDLESVNFDAIQIEGYARADAGNGDGRPNPGEELTMDMRIFNVSGSTKYGVTATLSSTSEYIEFTNNSFTYGDLTAGWYDTIGDEPYGSSNFDYYAAKAQLSATHENAFAFTIADDTPFDTEIPIDVTFTDSAGNTWDDSLSITVVRTGADITYQSHELADSGHGDAAPKPGESMTMDMRVHNAGTSDVIGVTATLSSPSEYIEFTNNSFTYGDLTAGWYDTIGDEPYGSSNFDYYAAKAQLSATHENAFAFTIDSKTPNETEIPIAVSFTDTQNNSWNDSFSITVTEETAESVALTWSLPGEPETFFSGDSPVLNRSTGTAMVLTPDGAFTDVSWLLNGNAAYGDGTALSVDSDTGGLAVDARNMSTLGMHEVTALVTDSAGRVYSKQAFFSVTEQTTIDFEDSQLEAGFTANDSDDWTVTEASDGYVRGVSGTHGEVVSLSYSGHLPAGTSINRVSFAMEYDDQGWSSSEPFEFLVNGVQLDGAVWTSDTDWTTVSFDVSITAGAEFTLEWRLNDRGMVSIDDISFGME